MKKGLKLGFTLAEILITLGIIGIVAALTIPPTVQNYKKTALETKLKKFYSDINQAINLAEIDYGPRETWDSLRETGLTRTEWINKYIVPYIKTVKVEGDDNSDIKLYLANGFVLIALYNGNDSLSDWNLQVKEGRELRFCFNPSAYVTQTKGFERVTRNFEPYKYNWDGTKENLYSKCDSSGGACCCAIIQLNGWKIPDDFPLKF